MSSRVSGAQSYVSPMKRFHPFLALLTSAAFLFGFVACGGDDEDTTVVDGAPVETESGSDAPDLDLGSDGVTIEQGDNTVTMSGLGVPDDFPDSVWLPDGYEVLSAQNQDYGGSVSWNVLGSVAKPPAEVEAELIAHYGEPDERDERSETTIVEWADHDGHDLEFTLHANVDGDTVLTTVVWV